MNRHTLDDFLDCFGDPAVTGRNGTDIQDGKCTWLAVVALQRASPSQKQLMEAHYASANPVDVAKIKDLYEDLQLPHTFSVYEEATYDLLRTQIQQVDDSIIYRRHSSSSYSSTCMSPRRLSDVETGAAQMAAKAAALSDQNQAIEDNDKKADSFMADSSGTANETINKDDCLSLKEKLNTKLSLALKKRKRETNTKTDKPPKQKRVSKTISAEKDTPIKTENLDNYKHISVNFEQRLVEICIRKTGSIKLTKLLVRYPYTKCMKNQHKLMWFYKKLV